MLAFFNELLVHHQVLLWLLSINLIIGIFSQKRSKVNSFTDYALAGRRLPTLVLVVTFLATFIGSGELYLPNVMEEHGISFVAVHFVCITLSFWSIGTFVAPFLIHFNKSITIGEIMGNLYGPMGRFVTGIVGGAVSLIVLVVQLSAIGSLSFSLLHINPYGAIIYFGLVFVLYSVWGGVRAVSYTDILQVLLIFAVLAWVSRLALGQVGGLQGIYDYFQKARTDKIVALKPRHVARSIKELCFWNLSCTFCLTLPIFQRMLMVRNKRQVREMWYISAGLYAIFFLMLSLTGFSGVVLKAEGKITSNNKDFLLKIVQHLFAKDSWMKDLITAGLLGLILSTADSFLHSVGVSVLHDLVEPMKLWIHGRSFVPKRKSLYARFVVGLLGCFALVMALLEHLKNSSVWSVSLYSYAIVLYGLILWPLLIGIFGLKTDKFSLLSYFLCYVGCTATFMYAKWEKHDYFWIVVGLSLVSYFIIHVSTYKGFVVLDRTKYTTTEKFWGAISRATLRRWMNEFFNLPSLARKCLLTSASPSPMLFCLMLFGLSTLQTMMTIESYDNFGVVGYARMVSSILCILLLAKSIWPKKLRPYYAIYWFFTLFFTIPFTGTLAFLRVHKNIFTAVHWIGLFVLLACLVDSILFLALGGTGIVLASLVWYWMGKGFVPLMLMKSKGYVGVYGMSLLFIFVILFKREKDKKVKEKLYWNRVTTSNLVHELSDPIQMLNGLGYMIRTAFSEGHTMVDTEGKEGFFIQKRQYSFLNRFSTHVIERSKEAQKDLSHFTKFIEQQILGIFAEQSVSMYGYVKEGIRRVSSQYLEKVKIELTCTKDFKAKVLSSVFPNVIASLISSAYHHGHASIVAVKVDGNERKISIRDNGEGIPPEIFPYIFDLHYSECRMHKAGLAFTRMVIEASRGKVSCYSKYKGENSFTEFVIELP